MLPETTIKRIKQEATGHMHSYVRGMIGDDEFTPSNLMWSYIAGATAEAELNHKEIETLKAWKESASAQLKKICDWGHSDGAVPLGKGIIDEAVKRLKAYDKLQQKAQLLTDALEKIMMCKRLTGEESDNYKANRMWHIADNALQQWRGK